MNDNKVYTLSPDEIRGALLSTLGRRFVKVLSDKSGKSGPWVSRHISGTLSTPAGKELIAEALNRKVSDIWPDTKPDKQAA